MTALHPDTARQAVRLSQAGYDAADAAAELGVTVKSIRNYLMDARRALGVDTTDEAVARARELRLIR